MVKPVKRENSNTTNTTHITGITASTNGTTAGKNNAAFYSTLLSLLPVQCICYLLVLLIKRLRISIGN